MAKDTKLPSLELIEELNYTVEDLEFDKLCLLERLERSKTAHRTAYEELVYNAAAQVEELENILTDKQCTIYSLKSDLKSERALLAERDNAVLELTKQLELCNEDMTGLKETIVDLRRQQAAALVADRSDCIARLETIAVDILRREMTALADDLCKERLASGRLRDELVHVSAACVEMENACEQWRRLHEEELNKTKELTEELSHSQCNQLYSGTMTQDEDDALLQSLEQEINTDYSTAEELSARPPSVICPPEAMLPAGYVTSCDRCSVLQLELDNAREDMKTMNEQILKVAKQKYELQLQLEAWQNDMEQMIEKQLQTTTEPNLMRNNNK